MRVSADTANVCSLKTLRALVDFELHLLVLLEVAITVALDRTEVYEDVRPALLGDETVSLLRVEPFHGSNGHKQSLLFWPDRSSSTTGTAASGRSREGSALE